MTGRANVKTQNCQLGGTVQPVEAGSDVTRDPRPAFDPIRSALQACEAYFEGRADAEYFTDSASPCGNEEMHLLVEVQNALRTAA